MRACNSVGRMLDSRGDSVAWSEAFSSGGGGQSDK
jgi:hypothetical protein